MNFFGIEVAMIGYQGTVFPVLLAVWFMSLVENGCAALFLTRWI